MPQSSPPIQPRSKLDGLRRFNAWLVAGAALVSAGSMLAPWHDVASVNVKRAATAFYVGPDYHASAADRARALDLSEHSICTGLDHLDLGAWPALIFMGLAAIAIATLYGKHTRAHVLGAITCLAGAFAAFWTVLTGSLLRHLFAKPGPPLIGEQLFNAGYGTLLLGFVLLAALLIATAVRDRKRPSPRLDDAPANARGAR